MADPQARVRLTVDEDGAIETLKRFNTISVGAFTELNSAVQLFKQTITPLVGTFKELLTLAAEQERTEKRVIAALRQRGEFTDKNFEALQKFNGALQQQLGFGDEQLLQMQGTLAALGVMPREIDQATKATIGLAEATGQSLNEAGRIVAKVIQGNIGALKEYGVTVKNTDEAMAFLLEKFDVAAAQSDTLAVRTRTLESNWFDLKETLGLVAVEAVNANDSMRDLSDTILGMISFIKENKNAIVEFARDLGRAAGIAAALNPLTAIPGLVTGGPLAAALGAARERGAAERQEGQPFGPELPPGFDLGGGGNRPGAATEPTGPRTIRNGFPGGANTPGLGDIFGLQGLIAPASEQQRALDLENLDRQRELAEAQQEIDQMNTDRAATNAARREDIRKKEMSQWEGLIKSVGPQIGAGMANMFQAMFSGSQSAGEALAGFAGGVVTSIGQMLVQLGTAALVAQLFALIPFLAPLVGPPGASAAAGAAALAAGVAMMGVGAAMGAAGGGGGARSSAGSPGGARIPGGVGGVGADSGASDEQRRRAQQNAFFNQLRNRDRDTQAPAGFVPSGAGGPGTIVNNYSVNFDNFYGQPDARSGQAILDAIAQADRLRGRSGGRFI